IPLPGRSGVQHMNNSN
ncbi:hypothetical protein Trydic_g4706, partial [Trypoxylus dichotomus]